MTLTEEELLEKVRGLLVVVEKNFDLIEERLEELEGTLRSLEYKLEDFIETPEKKG